MDRTVLVTQKAIEQHKKETGHYRAAVKSIMLIINFQAIIIVVLSLGLFLYVYKIQRQDRYYAETSSGARMSMIGLPMPNIGKTAITNWVSQAAIQIMTFGFNDIDQQFAISRKNFTQDGWDSFFKAMIKSGFVKKITDAQQIITAIPRSEPTLSKEGIMDGVYTWVFDMDMIITIRSGSAKQTLVKSLHVNVEQVPTDENPMALGIGLWVLN